MRIGVDISICAFNAAGGARHAAWLLRALQHEAAANGDHVVPLGLPRRLWSPAASAGRKALVLFWEFVYAPQLLGLLAHAQRCDLVHLTSPTPIASLQCPVVSTIHDLLPALYPHYFSRLMGLRLRRWFKRTLRASTHVIASSQHTARDLRRIASDLSAPVSVVYPASFLAPRPASHAAPSNSEPYILAVGTLEPRKNLPAVLEAFAALPASLRDSHTLLLVGSVGWLAPDVAHQAARLGIAERVRSTGYVDDVKLAALYADAELLMFPSFYEGFGFPPLEAMSCGCPVVASSAASLPEVVGNAAVLVDPHSVPQLAAALRLVLEQRTLAQRLRERGYAQAARFSWQRAARETFDVYRSVFTAVPSP